MQQMKNHVSRFIRFLKGETVQDDRGQVKRFFTILGLAALLGLLISPLAIIFTHPGSSTGLPLGLGTPSPGVTSPAPAASATPTPVVPSPVSNAPIKGLTDNPAYQWWRWPNHPQPDSWWGDDQTDQTLGAQISLMQELGVKLFRVELVWAFVAPTRPGGTTYDSATARNPNWSGYHWDRWDRIVRLTQSAGIQLVPQVVYTPDWASGVTTTTSDGPNEPPQSAQYFGDFVYAAVTRYKGQIHYWELWNEPDYPDHTWKDYARTNSLQSYVDLILKPGYLAAKQVDPSVQVLLGGLAGDSVMGKVYAAGGGPYFDIGNFHSYLRSPGVAAGKDHVRGAMNQNGDKVKPIWLTEFGVEAQGSNDEAFQARLIHDVYQLQGLQAIFLYQLHDTDVYADGSVLKHAYWGIVSHDLTHRKQGFDAYKAVAGAPLPLLAHAVPSAETVLSGIWLASSRVPMLVVHMERREALRREAC